MTKRRRSLLDRYPAWPVVALSSAYLSICLFYLFWTWSTELGDFGGDNAFYLMIARHLSFWSASDSVTQFFSTHSLYPPLYPAILGLFGGGASVLVAHCVTTAMLCLSFAAFYFWLRRVECPTGTAAALTVLFAALPGTYMLALSILSESTYLLFTLLAVVAVSMHEQSKRSHWLWIATACVAAAALTRSAGVTLIAAYGVYLALHRPMRFWLHALVAAIPFILWNISHQSSDVGYLSALMEKRSADLIAGLFEQLRIQSMALWTGWISSFSDAPIAIPLASALALFGLVGTAVRLWQRKFDGFYVAFYFALILIWPFPAEASRFIFVLIPFLLAHAWILSRRASFVIGSVRFHAAHFVLLVFYILALSELLLIAQRFAQPMPPELSGFRRTADWYDADPAMAQVNVALDKALTDGMRAIPDHVPEGECVYSIKPSLVGFYARRISVVPPREHVDAEAFKRALAVQGCRYFFTIGFASPSYRTQYYPMERLARGRVLDITRIPGHRYPVSILVKTE